MVLELPDGLFCPRLPSTRIQRALLGVRRSIAIRGFVPTVAHAVHRVVAITRGVSLVDIEHPFDRTFGVDTSGVISGMDTPTGHRNDLYITGYYAIAPSVFQQMFQLWRDTLPDSGDTKPEDFTFIDLGAGKGRALLMASEIPFRKVIGVELSADLVQVAQKNIEIWKQKQPVKSDIEILQQDATEYEWPTGALLIYLFNPFGKPILEAVARQIKLACKGRSAVVDLIYMVPEYCSVLDEDPNFRLLWDKRIPMDEPDLAADAFKGQTCHGKAYRLIQ